MHGKGSTLDASHDGVTLPIWQQDPHKGTRHGLPILVQVNRYRMCHATALGGSKQEREFKASFRYCFDSYFIGFPGAVRLSLWARAKVCKGH